MKTLIGGQALRNLGHNRHTIDMDYLIFDENLPLFSKEDGNDVDYINASKNSFLKQIYDLEKGKEQASADSLFELKAWAWINHLQNGNMKKAVDCEFDFYFLLTIGAKTPSILKKYVTPTEWSYLIQEIEAQRKKL